MQSFRRTIFVDVSEVTVMGGRSGIQRVVRRIVHEAAADPDLGVLVEPVVSRDRRLWRLNDRGRAAFETADRADRRDGTAPLILKRDRLPVRAAKRVLRLVPGLHERLRNRKLERSFRDLVEPQPVSMNVDDVYVVLDSFWTRSSAPGTAAALRRQGSKVVAMVYDALMLTHPNYVISEVAARFAKELRRMTDAGIPLISISGTAAREIGSAATTRDAVGYFYQGYDLPEPPRSAEVEWPGGLWTGAPVFLTVGTFEPRKNQEQVVRAFEALWAGGIDVKLVMIGQIGVGSETFVGELALHPRLGRSLFVFHKASDAQVGQAYRRATALILPSFVEGFGLPLVEGLGLELPVIASDIAVFREIGGEACRYFDPLSADALAEAVRDVVAELPEWQRRAAAFRWISWREATRRFVATVKAATG